ncbi:uncharacterized protein [Nicotiana sylvestris]|uniref:uncharacterized protein n=1 Tax=Nicotiana sylvestris TaxID=4096 RepID=UPI00388C5424
MSNPQDNPGTPPQPTPSDSSTPSTQHNPQPRRRRVKMFARKTVATDSRFVLVGSVRNVEIPESRRRGGKNKSKKEKESKGMSSDMRGKGKEVADPSPTSEISQADEPGSSINETLADLLKKVGASYDPKKRRTLTPKAPSSAKTTNKRKASSPTTVEISLPKGRATRSKLKQSVEELQKAMAESKKMRMDKGKAKTPKPKKTKPSSKKSSSVSKADEPSSLAKRTRSAVKAKQVKITEDDDWSDE